MGLEREQNRKKKERDQMDARNEWKRLGGSGGLGNSWWWWL